MNVTESLDAPQKVSSDYLASPLADRVRNNREVDPMSLVEEYIGLSYSRQFARQSFVTGMPLMIGDAISFTICFWLGLGASSAIGFSIAPAYSFFFIVLMCAILGTFLVMGLYNGGGMHPIYEFRQTMVSTTLIFVLVSAVMVSSSTGLATLISYPFMLMMVPLVRNWLRSKLVNYSWWGVRCVVLNCDRRANSLFTRHLENSYSGLRPIGFLQATLPANLKPELTQYYRGTVENARNVISSEQAHCAIVHRCGRPDHEIFDFVSNHLTAFSRVVIVPDDNRLPSLWSLGRSGGLCLEDRLLRPSSQRLKRMMDVVCAAGGLLALSPLFAIIAIWTKVTAPGPLFFGHERIGKHGRRFKAWKFRTMLVNSQEILEKTLAENPEMKAEWEETYKLQNDPRITGPGHLLRKTSLDELPQLWNVLVGQMSLVGPRPIVVGEVDRYRDTFKNYLRVTPGITGFWQVSGRNLTSYDRRVELDDYYVRNWSIWFDLYILIRTVKTVLWREGAF